MTDDDRILKYKLQTLLRDNVMEISFTKVNGEQRTMRCTLKTALLPEPPKEGPMTHPKPENVLPVWDIDKNGWRSFRVDSVHDYITMKSEV